MFQLYWLIIKFDLLVTCHLNAIEKNQFSVYSYLFIDDFVTLYYYKTG